VFWFLEAPPFPGSKEDNGNGRGRGFGHEGRRGAVPGGWKGYIGWCAALPLALRNRRTGVPAGVCTVAGLDQIKRDDQ
jgi:hypothetical protein